MKKLLFLFTALAFCLTSFAQTNTFNNGSSDGFWITDGNWSKGHHPTVSEEVVIPSPHAVTIQSTTTAVAKSVEVKTGGSLTVLGTLTIEEPPPTTVTSLTGKIWMDRNLGASRVAEAKNDALAYGDYYQWGRLTDGHEKLNSGTTATLSNTDVPGHGDFITNTTDPRDWRTPKNDNLWQGVNGINNPCPAGFRLPTEAEWNAEKEKWVPQNSQGAFESILKLPMCGYRDVGGGYEAVGTDGYYWSSVIANEKAQDIFIYSGSSGLAGDYRASGQSVRCIKD